MQRFSSFRDLTGVQPSVQVGQAPTLLFLCGHKGLRNGAELRGQLLVRCPACVKEKARG
jgi:hypothetical protein